jgi:hypothetical protein
MIGDDFSGRIALLNSPQPSSMDHHDFSVEVHINSTGRMVLENFQLVPVSFGQEVLIWQLANTAETPN